MRMKIILVAALQPNIFLSINQSINRFVSALLSLQAALTVNCRKVESDLVSPVNSPARCPARA